MKANIRYCYTEDLRLFWITREWFLPNVKWGSHENMGLFGLSCVVLYLEEAEQGISGYSVNQRVNVSINIR